LVEEQRCLGGTPLSEKAIRRGEEGLGEGRTEGRSTRHTVLTWGWHTLRKLRYFGGGGSCLRKKREPEECEKRRGDCSQSRDAGGTLRTASSLGVCSAIMNRADAQGNQKYDQARPNPGRGKGRGMTTTRGRTDNIGKSR